MDHNISHNGLYQEYEARVAKAVRNYQIADEAPRRSRTTGNTWEGLRTWLVALRARIERNLQPMEPEGEIA